MATADLGDPEGAAISTLSSNMAERIKRALEHLNKARDRIRGESTLDAA